MVIDTTKKVGIPYHTCWSMKEPQQIQERMFAPKPSSAGDDPNRAFIFTEVIMVGLANPGGIFGTREQTAVGLVDLKTD